MFLQMLKNQSLVVHEMRLSKWGAMEFLRQLRLVGQRMMIGKLWWGDLLQWVWDGGGLVIWVLRVGEVPVAEIVVIDSGDVVAGSSAKGMFTIEIY
jgi:hypothetical protein